MVKEMSKIIQDHNLIGNNKTFWAGIRNPLEGATASKIEFKIKYDKNIQIVRKIKTTKYIIYSKNLE